MALIITDECINCDVCEPECPIDAIRAEEEVPAAQQGMIALNAELSKHPGWTQITEAREPLPDHEQWRGKPGKLAFLDRNGA